MTKPIESMEIIPQPLLTDNRFQNLTGNKFERLTVIAYAGQNKNKISHWYCRCDCGQVRRVCSYNLKSGITKSCGCLRRESAQKRFSTHGLRSSSEYNTWAGMKNRCLNPSQICYESYGGRGIVVCDRWLNSFENFLEDMGKKPSRNHSIERIDQNGIYEKSNCRWATKKEQARNTRSNRLVTFDGETLCIAEWSERTGLDSRTIFARIDTLGWSIERALTKPLPSGWQRRNTAQP